MSDLRTKAKEVYGQMTPLVSKQHSAAWSRCENRVVGLMPKGTKVFEVQHAIEHARKIYLNELVVGSPSDLCERRVLEAYRIS